jgi:hypothetical protein
MKGIDSTGAPLVYVPGWVDGWMEVKAVLRIAYSNQKDASILQCFILCKTKKLLLSFLCQFKIKLENTRL